MSRADLPGLARRGSLGLAGGAVSAVLNLGLVLVITHGLGRHDAGVFFTATSFFALVETVCLAGTPTGLVYFIARFRALGQSDRVGGCLRAAFTPVAAVSVSVAVVVEILAPRLAGALVSGPPGALTTYLRVLAVGLPVAALFDAAVAATRGYHQVAPSALVDRIGRCTLQLAAVAVAVFTFSAAGGTASAWVAPYGAGLLVAGVWLARLHRGDGAGGPVVTGEFWRYTLPRSFASVAQIVLQRLDIVLVGVYLGASQAAVYTAATRFLVVGQVANSSIALAVAPKLSELLAHHDISETGVVYRSSTGWLVLITWPAYLLCAVAAPTLLKIFGSGYGGGTAVVVILALAMLVATGCGMVDHILTMAGRTGANLLNVTVAVAINVAGNIVLIPTLHLAGAALAWAAAIAANNLLPLAQVWRMLRLHPWGAGTVLAAGLAVGCFAVLPGAAVLLTGHAVVGLLVGVAAAVLIYLPCLWFGRRRLELDALFGSVRARAVATVR